MINIKYIGKKCLPLLVAGVTAIGASSCSNKNGSKKVKIDTNDTKAYTLEQYTDVPYLYTVKTYDSKKAKNQKYEMKTIKKPYEVKCTPIEFKNYVNEKDVTWDDIKLTIEKSEFDEYHKSLLVRGINNLKKNNFNMDLAVLNYNLKNINIEYVDFYKEDVLGAFDCFEHKIILLKNMENTKKYEIVFLHEMLGHGMTDAYIEESKVYCSLDTPTYVIDENNNFVGFSLYGNAFTEATAQIIALTALDKELCQEYMSGYDLCMVELLMLCKDNNCALDEYANYGIKKLEEKMKKNNIDAPYDILGIVSYNLETSQMKETPNFTSHDIMYDYFFERVTDELDEGTSFEKLNNDIKDIFNYPAEYVSLLANENNEQLVILYNDYINLTGLYNEIGNYACDKVNTK